MHISALGRRPLPPTRNIHYTNFEIRVDILQEKLQPMSVQVNEYRL
jgi:hypothetical protein